MPTPTHPGLRARAKDEAAPGGPTPTDRAEMIKQQLAAFEQAGYVTRNNGRFESHLEFKNGALTANGKPLGAGPPGP